MRLAMSGCEVRPARRRTRIWGRACRRHEEIFKLQFWKFHEYDLHIERCRTQRFKGDASSGWLAAP